MRHTIHPFNEQSFWAGVPADIQSPLEGNNRCAVAVVGGGITGLATALSLKEAGIDVSLIEADFCGAGASSRAAGHVTPTIGKNIAATLKTFGKDRGTALVRYAEHAVAFFESTIKTYEIDCDYIRTGNITAGVHASQRRSLEESVSDAAALGIDLTFLSSSDMRARRIPEAFLFGMLEGAGGTIHTGKYVLGLRRAALQRGLKIYERSPITKVEPGSTITLRANAGVMKADHVVLATNAYTVSSLKLLKSKVVPIRVSQFVTPPLSAKDLEAIGWPNKEGIYTAHEILENFRLTVDNRIVGGSKNFVYAYGSKLAPAYQQDTFDMILRAFRERFPMLTHIPIESFWGGWFTMTLDFLPVRGHLGKHGNLSYYSGCNGHGIPQCTLIGSLLADEILGRRSPYDELFDRFMLPLPPEPIRYGIIETIRRQLTGSDRRIDDKIRAGV
jgi:gamma-glutamylputrescine oxidase